MDELILLDTNYHELSINGDIQSLSVGLTPEQTNQ